MYEDSAASRSADGGLNTVSAGESPVPASLFPWLLSRLRIVSCDEQNGQAGL